MRLDVYAPDRTFSDSVQANPMKANRCRLGPRHRGVDGVYRTVAGSRDDRRVALNSMFRADWRPLTEVERPCLLCDPDSDWGWGQWRLSCEACLKITSAAEGVYDCREPMREGQMERFIEGQQQAARSPKRLTPRRRESSRSGRRSPLALLHPGVEAHRRNPPIGPWRKHEGSSNGTLFSSGS